MTVLYQPAKLLKKLANKKRVERLITGRLTVNRVALNAIADIGVLSKKELEYVALGVVRKYRDRKETLIDEGFTAKDAADEILDDPKLLVQQVQNAVVSGLTDSMAEKYKGEKYTWLESTSSKRRKEHVKKYGKVFRLREGADRPGILVGCRCGMRIHARKRA